MEYFSFQYFEYYQRHTYAVVLAWKDIQDILTRHNIISEKEFYKINRLIIFHDSSKLDWEEFAAYGLKYYPVMSTMQSSSKVDSIFKKAWIHHKGHNLHHHQSLNQYQGDDWKCYIIEMICDWIAMGWETGSLVSDYYEQKKDSIVLPSTYRLFLEQVLSLIKQSDALANKPLSNQDESQLAFK